jgi:hypothetical protein
MSRKSHPLLRPSDRPNSHFGAPALIVFDNSREFFSIALLEAAIANDIGAHYTIPPGTENAESV